MKMVVDTYVNLVGGPEALARAMFESAPPGQPGSAQMLALVLSFARHLAEKPQP